MNHEYDFGQVFIGAQDAIDIALSNQGDGDLQFPDDVKINIDGDLNDFIIDTSSLINVIFPQDTIPFSITFKPIMEGFKEIQISIYSNDPLNPIYKLVVKGNGISDGTTAIIGDLNSKVLIYPVPAAHTLNITGLSGKVNVQIISEYGQNVYHENLINDKIDVSFLANGIYLLKLSTDADVLTRKLIIKR